MDRRHIQNHSEGGTEIYHWGYATRVFPCTNDAGSCEYLDAVYWMHDISMLYTFIMWYVLAGIFALWIAFRCMKPGHIPTRTRSGEEIGLTMSQATDNAFYRLTRTVSAFFRRHLLPESPIRYFGHVTRLQLLILAVLAGYLTVFSFVGIVYKTWITPVKGTTNLFNTRSGLGGYSDRIGAQAYALTPFTVLLSSRESLLTLITGVSYQHFNFLHRWCGRIIFIQAAVHTFGWTLIEAKFYQPQPKVYNDFIKQEYMIYGCVAMGLLSFLYIFSIRRVIQWTGYEFFRKTHFITAALYIGACWGHWEQLKCWMIAALAVVFLDKSLRLLRVLMLQVGLFQPGTESGLFKAAQASISYYEDNGGIVIRLDFDHHHSAWKAGQHFFLTFPKLSIWQSHPFTVASCPTTKSSSQHHTYVIRALRGETSKLAKLAQELSHSRETMPVIIMGPYGASVISEAPNVLTIAGGTGISFTAPLAREVLRRSRDGGHASKFVWVIRQIRDLEWMKPELDALCELSARNGAVFDAHIYVTREAAPSPAYSRSHDVDEKRAMVDTISPVSSISEKSSSTPACSHETSIENHQRPTYISDVKITYLGNAHPDLASIVQEALDSEAFAYGAVQVLASGPAGMGTDLRRIVAASNDAGMVWKGAEGKDVSLHWDDRAY